MSFWDRFRKSEKRAASVSLSNPFLADLWQIGNRNYSGVEVNEYSALGLSAVYRAVALISGTIASLPMRTVRDVDGTRTRMNSFLDSPGGPEGQTKFEWLETVLLHLLLHGNAYLAHIYNGAGAIVALVPIHPLLVSTETRPGFPAVKLFTITLIDGTRRTYDESEMTHIPALSMDGLFGMSPISVARNSFGTSIAGDRATAKIFSNGAMISGLVSADGEDVISEDEAKVIKDTVNRKVTGWENAGDIAVINRKLKFTPWTMSAQDAQFLQSRQFQVEEVARWFGVPPHLLMLTEKSTSWGTGLEEQNRALARTVLAPWTNRIEQRLSRLLPSPRFVEFDFAGLERPNPEQEISLLIKQVQAGLITVNEARKIRNLPPVDGGDELRISDRNVAQEELAGVTE